MPYRHFPVRLAALVIGLILTGCAASPATGPDPASGTQATAASILASLPVFPGADPFGAQVPMAMGSPSSSYLQVASAAYSALAPGHAIEAWYEAALGKGGWKRSATSSSTEKGKVTEYGESLTKDGNALVSVNLSFLPSQGGRTTFMVTVDDIAVPPRPASSLVPASVRQVVIRARTSGSAPWKTAVVSSPSSVRRWVARINGLTLFPAGSAAFNCAADFGQAAALTFRSSKGSSWTFRVIPACVQIRAPDGSMLSEGSVWNQVTALLGLAPAQGGSTP